MAKTQRPEPAPPGSIPDDSNRIVLMIGFLLIAAAVILYFAFTNGGICG